MCGIYGIYNYANNKEISTAALGRIDESIKHRGPDSSGVFVKDNFAFGMRRLAVIDLCCGEQPIFNENRTMAIVFNGEIYNYKTLREELKQKGHTFSTDTDTEVVLHLYEEEGVECVKKLRGMFAFAIKDKSRLFIARDRIGKKPLNYFAFNGTFAFCSELRGLLELDIPREINPVAVDMFLSLQYIPSPYTIYKHINKLMPGHYILLEHNEIKIKQYWDLPLNEPEPDISFGRAKTMVANKLRESVKIRMISDVPLGAFLSGGIDSSIIVALMSELSDKPVKTFSVGFDNQDFTETHYARMVAKMYGCDHNEFIVNPDMADILPKLAWHYSEPFGDPSALPSYYVSKETRKHVTVALNGDGGDENFAGYLRYKAMVLAHYWDLMPRWGRKATFNIINLLPERNAAPLDFAWRAKRFFMSAIESDFKTRHLRVAGFFHDENKKGLYTQTFEKKLGGKLNFAKEYLNGAYLKAEHQDFINRLLYVDMKTYLPECLMPKIDIASMAVSLEGRSPLLDHELMEMVFKMKGAWKLSPAFTSKHLLKEAFKDKLPKEIINRKKMGFGIPLGPWFRGKLQKFWQDICLSDIALTRGYFNPDSIKNMWQEHQCGKKDHGYRLWALLMLELWHLNFEPSYKVPEN